MIFEEGKILKRIDRVIDGKTRETVFRFVEHNDLEKIIAFVNDLIEEKAYLPNLRSEDTPAWFDKNLTSCKRGEGLLVVMEVDGNYGGHSLIERGAGETFHTGELGIMLVKEFRGTGLGEKLINIILEMSKDISGLELVWLDFYAENIAAEKLYKKAGFITAAVIPGFYCRDSRYIDKKVMFTRL